ncbi:hypothetical protein C7B65_26060 [Phormidesmis priestleyi ULC007]|uniref:Uncharacterized protein n=1 Tax=Phormidesmis priestleyi ULC007 TaxID=1920490 RepID=A0A2T1D2L2_9CYAN|nr:hypothetical protein [Phormidesmis priestleyi]PSB14671.1 hypothetical protein C7B65_26060 [Phormidesmis priestleyi ULC007]
MEPVTIAAAIATLFFSESLKAGGKSFGEGASKIIAQIVSTVRNKFRAFGTEGLLTRAEKQPTEINVDSVKAELVTQMAEDQDFAVEIADLLARLESTGMTIQLMGSEINITGDLEVDRMTQKTSGDSFAEQRMLTNVKAQNIKLGELTQENKSYES